jgi:aspartyl aminopeptidase
MTTKRRSKKSVKAKETPAPASVRVWDKLSLRERDRAMGYAEGYRQFLNRVRTERMAAADLIGQAKKKRFVELKSPRTRGNKIYALLRSKLLFMAVMGKKPLTEGIRLITSHIDCPRLDLKPNPLYEDTDLALLKTHYYGGIKKYQWVSRPLAMVGTVILGNGSSVDVEVGLDPEEPVLTIPDLLPHLDKKQREKRADEFIPAENLNVIAGGLPHGDADAEHRVKRAVLELLEGKYGITEEDFTSAEIQIVPADPARDAGLDRSFIAGYGQDDRVCAYTSCTALLETEKPEHTAVAVFYDKEEIGSEGNTSARSRFLELFLMDLMEKSGTEPTAQNLNRLFFNGRALSADVNAAFDPTYSEVFEKRNACKAGFGIVVEKHTGHGGKYMASDASAEYTGWIRNLLNRSNVVWQTGGHGKVDEGGGGTVAKFLARTGMEIIDIGPPILGMHSPLEVVSKEDVWMCHRAFSAFFKS